MAALSQRHSQTAPGACYRHLSTRLGGDVAVFATAGKLATYVYRLLRWEQQYVDEGAEAIERRFQNYHIRSLKAKAKKAGYQLEPIPA
jgi:transposase